MIAAAISSAFGTTKLEFMSARSRGDERADVHGVRALGVLARISDSVPRGVTDSVLAAKVSELLILRLVGPKGPDVGSTI